MRHAAAAIVLGLVVGGCGETGFDARVQQRADGTAGVGVFETAEWGTVALEYEWLDGRMVHGGDVVLEPDLLVEELSGNRAAEGRTITTSQALVRRKSLTPWPKVNGVVTIPYKWDSNMPDGKKAKVRKAMDNWEEELGFLKFVQNQSATGRWVRVVSKSQSYCYVTMRSSGETVLEAGNSCTWHTHVHELGHVLGLRHEQLRKDRSSHVNFYKSRTTSPNQFCWDDGRYCIGADYLGTSYDTASIMQYPSCMLATASSCGSGTPGKWVMERLTGSGYIPYWETRSFGQVLSASDKCGVKTMFGIACNSTAPPPACTPATCESLGRTCGGGHDDGCGGTLSCGTCAGAETCNAGTCVAANPFPVPSWVTGTLQSEGTGETLCAEVSAGSPDAGATVAMAQCSSTSTRQNWTFTRGAQFRNFETGQCAQASGAFDAALVTQQPCMRDALQQWKLGNMEIVNGVSGRCIDVPDANYTAGTTLEYWDCDGGENQRFTYDAETRELRIRGTCITAGDAAGTAVRLEACDGDETQAWNAARGGFANGANPGLCLAVAGGATSPAGAQIVVSDCNEAVDQMWALRGQVEHADDAYCLDTSMDSVTIATCDPTSFAQRITIWSNFGCTPTTCAEIGAECGMISDDCGQTVDCGDCPVCTPATCQALDACGVVDDECGGTLDCGACPDEEPAPAEDEGEQDAEHGGPSSPAAEGLSIDATGGCSCRVSGGDRSGGGLLLALLVLLRRRGRTRPTLTSC